MDGGDMLNLVITSAVVGRLRSLALTMVCAAGIVALGAYPALAAGPYLKLVETIVDPAGGMFPVVANGNIQQADPNYGTFEAEYAWTPPPDTMDGNGASI